MEFYHDMHPHESLENQSQKEYMEAANSGKLAPLRTKEVFTKFSVIKVTVEIKCRRKIFL
jgi:hypothetical protein